MKNPYQKIEFWAATLIYFFSVLLVIKGASHGPNYMPWTPNNAHNYKIELFSTSFKMLDYFVKPYLFRYSILYLTYLLFILKIVPDLRKGKRIFPVLCILVSYILVAVVIATTNTYLQVYLLYAKGIQKESIYYQIFFDSFIYTSCLFLLHGIYLITKFNCHKILIKFKNAQNVNFIIQDCITASSIWTLIFSFLYTGLTDYPFIWVYFVFFAIPLYAYFSLIVIPSFSEKQLKFRFYQWEFLKAILITSIAIASCTFFTNSIHCNVSVAFQCLGLNILFHCFITTPAAWYIYHYRSSKLRELRKLKTALRQSTASIDFLRAQINPHFLFNTLNTLYGTALQEKSKLTALGIQKLGDMMRFMLHENHQDKILLNKEIEYIKNYIELQILRIRSSPNIIIETDIHDKPIDRYIAPMLLIPFIENAFKHGISLKHKSWIKIKLHISLDRLFFDISNSIYTKRSEDLEKESGVGLENVKQRLALIYPQEHELIISATANEFLVSLIINLT